MRRGDPVVVVDACSPMHGRQGELVDFTLDGGCVVWFVMEDARRCFESAQLELVAAAVATVPRK